jgi:beta-galactosidase
MTIAGITCCDAASSTANATPTTRQAAPLASGWRFHFGEVGAQVVTDQFDDGAWQTVSVPHTWNRLGEVGTERSAATNNDLGVGWYRLRFNAPTRTDAQRQFLQFDAIGELADIWLNGKKLGTHAGAFSRFRFDVTDVLRAGQTNTLVVKADNSKPMPGSSTQDIIPLGGDFFVYGGIYREVALITANAVHMDLLDYGGPGVYAHASEVSNDQASINVLARLKNDSNKPRNIVVVTRVIDAAGNEVGAITHQARLAAASASEVNAKLMLAKPHLWNGRTDPYLYRVSVELRDGAKVLDSVEQPLGIRSYRIDANEGLFLNGQHLPLHGVSRHQDRAGKGWALSKADHEEDMALIADMGANAVRFAHYEHAQDWFDLADRYGMLVWSEIPFINAANFNSDEPTAALVANARQQLIEGIRQSYNHPSVFAWSVGNEINIGSFTGARKATKSLTLLRNLNELAKHEDPTRVTAFADCCESPPMKLPDPEPLVGTTDLIGYNRYFGWYYGKPADFGDFMDLMHARHPQLPIGISEYGAGGALSQHTQNPLGGVINIVGRPHPEEILSWYHEEAWPQIRARPYVWGSFIWNMFDFASDLRGEGDTVDLNDKGMVSFDRKTRKDVFFYYKAQWSSDPVVHINSSRYTERPYAVTDVRVYSNASAVSLKQNGKDVGSAKCEDHICVWHNLALNAGNNVLVASADFAGKIVSDSVQWHAPDAARGLGINVGDLVDSGAANGQLIGPDQFFSGGAPALLNGLSGGNFVKAGDMPARKTVTGGDAALYEGYRTGDFSYDIPMPNGTWRVTLHSFEPDAGLLATRTFDVLANDRVQLKAWSPGKAAGGVLKAADATFKIRVTDGHLHLKFESAGGPALLAAITIAPANMN